MGRPWAGTLNLMEAGAQGQAMSQTAGCSRAQENPGLCQQLLPSALLRAVLVLRLEGWPVHEQPPRGQLTPEAPSKEAGAISRLGATEARRNHRPREGPGGQPLRGPGPVHKWEAPSSLFREPSFCLGAVRIRVPGHTQAWPAHLAFPACQSSCSRKGTFFSHSIWIAAGTATGSREGLIIDGGGVQGHQPLKGLRAWTWEAWAPLPDRVRAPQHHHRESSRRGSPGPGPGRRTPIFRESDQRPGRVRTPLRPRPHPTPVLRSPALQVLG